MKSSSKRQATALLAVAALLLGFTLAPPSQVAAQGRGAQTIAMAGGGEGGGGGDEGLGNWCKEEQDSYGWWHDFDIFFTAGAHSFVGLPNSIHFYQQAGQCATYHYSGSGSPTGPL